MGKGTERRINWSSPGAALGSVVQRLRSAAFPSPDTPGALPETLLRQHNPRCRQALGVRFCCASAQQGARTTSGPEESSSSSAPLAAAWSVEELEACFVVRVRMSARLDVDQSNSRSRLLCYLCSGAFLLRSNSGSPRGP